MTAEQSSQFVERIGCNSLLLLHRYISFDWARSASKHISEYAELVSPRIEQDSSKKGSGSPAFASVMRVRGVSIWPARSILPGGRHQQDPQRDGCLRSKRVQEVGADGTEGAGSYEGATVGYVTQQEHPHDREQQAPATMRKPA